MSGDECHDAATKRVEGSKRSDDGIGRGDVDQGDLCNDTAVVDCEYYVGTVVCNDEVVTASPRDA